MTAVLPLGEASQTTQYVYGVTTAGGSGFDDNDLLQATQYPDPTTGAASTSQAETYAYDALGERTTYTDRNGTTHAYAYDSLGRLTTDAVTAFGAGVDQSVAKIGYTYTDQGQLVTATSYDASGNVVNQTSDTYDAFGNLAGEAPGGDGCGGRRHAVGRLHDRPGDGPAGGVDDVPQRPHADLQLRDGPGRQHQPPHVDQRRQRHDPELRVSGLGHAADGDQRQRRHPDDDAGRLRSGGDQHVHQQQRHDDRRPAVRLRPKQQRLVPPESGVAGAVGGVHLRRAEPADHVRPGDAEHGGHGHRRCADGDGVLELRRGRQLELEHPQRDHDEPDQQRPRTRWPASARRRWRTTPTATR